MPLFKGEVVKTDTFHANSHNFGSPLEVLPLLLLLLLEVFQAKIRV